MARQRNTSPRTRAKATEPAKAAKGKTLSRITAFDSKGQRYFRLTIPREFGARYESDMNRWEVTIKEDGSVVFKPVRELVAVS